MTTEPRASLVEVEQVDRDAVAALYLAHTAYPDAARSLVFATGKMDDHDFVQAFARHRLEALRTQGDGEGLIHEGGMVPWVGGKGAPADWDKGPVRLRDGSVFTPRSHVVPGWRWDRRNARREHDIVAYTSTATPTQASSREEGE